MLSVFRVGPPTRVNVCLRGEKLARHPRLPHLINRVTLPPGSPSSPRQVVICYVNTRFDLQRNVWIVACPGWPGEEGDPSPRDNFFPYKLIRALDSLVVTNTIVSVVFSLLHCCLLVLAHCTIPKCLFCFLSRANPFRSKTEVESPSSISILPWFTLRLNVLLGRYAGLVSILLIGLCNTRGLYWEWSSHIHSFTSLPAVAPWYYPAESTTINQNLKVAIVLLLLLSSFIFWVYFGEWIKVPTEQHTLLCWTNIDVHCRSRFTRRAVPGTADRIFK